MMSSSKTRARLMASILTALCISLGVFSAGCEVGMTNPMVFGSGSSWPQWTNDGRYIAVTDGDQFYERILVVASDGSHFYDLSHKIGPPTEVSNDRGISVSPKDGKIAFAQYRNKHIYLIPNTAYRRDFEIAVVDLDGENFRKLTKSRGADIEPSWSPDGERIAFLSERSDPRSLHVMNADGSEVTHMGGRFRMVGVKPSWSPDGSRIAFTSIESIGDEDWPQHEWGVAIANADGSGVTRLEATVVISDPNRYVNMGSPTWSSDGTKIAYATNEGRQPGTLYTINSDGSGLAERHVINAINLITDDAPDWSPDGTKILMGRVIVDLTDGKITGWPEIRSTPARTLTLPGLPMALRLPCTRADHTNCPMWPRHHPTVGNSYHCWPTMKRLNDLYRRIPTA